MLVFAGANQTKVPLELVAALQPFGKDAEYITISGSGRNALDFHIAFSIGELSKEDPEGCFHIISKDTGFDPLIEHARKKNIHVHRLKERAGPRDPMGGCFQQMMAEWSNYSAVRK